MWFFITKYILWNNSDVRFVGFPYEICILEQLGCRICIKCIIFPYEIKSCNIKKAEIIDELNSVFENARKKNYDYTYTKLADGKSVAEITDFILDDGSAVRVYCTDWSKATEEMKSTNYNDMLTVDITSKLIMDWLRNEAY